MAAPQIPNLLSLRGRGGARGRGRGRGRGSGPEPAEQETQEQAKERANKIVQLTDQDANLSRISAVNAGYLQDPFAHIFTPSSSEVPRRMPIINRGTYARTTAIDRLVTSFIKSTKGRKQIVSLGAGTDTRYLRLFKAGLIEDLVYHEIDFEANTTAKLERIGKHHVELDSMFPTQIKMPDPGGSRYWHTDQYHLHAFDLRDLAQPDRDVQFMPSRGSGPEAIARDIPTLILSECCLCYMTPGQVDAVIQRFLSYLTSSVGLVFYEPIKPADAFGRVMGQNLEKRGIQMPTLAQYPSLQAQRARFSRYGLSDGGKAVDIEFVMQRWVAEDERERIDRCEMLDEMEEWSLLAQHYCISFGWRHGLEGSSDQAEAWTSWEQLPAQES